MAADHQTKMPIKVERRLFTESSDEGEDACCERLQRAGVESSNAQDNQQSLSPGCPIVVVDSDDHTSTTPPMEQTSPLCLSTAGSAPQGHLVVVRPWESSTPKQHQLSPIVEPRLTYTHNRFLHLSGMSQGDRTPSPPPTSPSPEPQHTPRDGQPLAGGVGDSQEVLALLFRLLSQPEHAQWAHGVYMWYQLELQRLHAQYSYAALMNPAGQHKDMQAGLVARGAQLTAHTHLLVHSYLQAVTPSPRQQTTTPVSSQRDRREGSVESLNQSDHHSNASTVSDDSAYGASPTSSLSPPSPVQHRSHHANHHHDNLMMPASTPSTTTTPPSNKRSLPTKAIQMMESWYQANFDHPYPTGALVQHFAEAGGITVQQVKKWMANKRVRSLNTLSYNGSIHPKRLQRIMRERQAAQPMHAPRSVGPYPSPKLLSASPTMC